MDEFHKGFEALAGLPKGSSRPRPHAKTGAGVSLTDSISRLAIGEVAPQWYKGPRDPEGILIDHSDRPTVCMSVRGREAVIGSTDHALYTFDIDTGRQKRTLYNKRYGHKEWVTCCDYLKSDGRIVSGGMDSKLCLWDASGVRCKDLMGHTQSVSCVLASDNGEAILSGAYDKTVRVWDPRRGTEMSVLSGHKGPVLDLAWQPQRVVSGGRGGLAIAWDLESGKKLGVLKGHKGHVTSVTWYCEEDTNVFLSGAQDGCVRIWDLRAKKAVANVPAHVHDNGTGAVAGIESTLTQKNDVIVSAGADREIAVIDPRAGFEMVDRFTDHKDFIYSIHVVGDICLTGAGDGMLLAHDLKKRKLLWGLGANKAAVRCIGATPDRLVASGDDGNTLIYEMA